MQALYLQATPGGMFSGMLCGFYVEGLRKNMKNLWIVNVPGLNQVFSEYKSEVLLRAMYLIR